MVPHVGVTSCSTWCLMFVECHRPYNSSRSHLSPCFFLDFFPECPHPYNSSRSKCVSLFLLPCSSVMSFVHAIRACLSCHSMLRPTQTRARSPRQVVSRGGPNVSPTENGKFEGFVPCFSPQKSPHLSVVSRCLSVSLGVSRCLSVLLGFQVDSAAAHHPGNWEGGYTHKQGGEGTNHNEGSTYSIGIVPNASPSGRR